jgi:hypothetical protein
MWSATLPKGARAKLTLAGNLTRLFTFAVAERLQERDI